MAEPYDRDLSQTRYRDRTGTVVATVLLVILTIAYVALEAPIFFGILGISGPG